MEQLQKAKVEQIARKLAEQYDEQYKPIKYEDRHGVSGYYGPWVFPGSHEEANSNWIISWEGGPEYSWPFKQELIDIVNEVAPEFYAEAINHYAVGFYPAH